MRFATIAVLLVFAARLAELVAEPAAPAPHPAIEIGDGRLREIRAIDFDPDPLIRRIKEYMSEMDPARRNEMLGRIAELGAPALAALRKVREEWGKENGARLDELRVLEDRACRNIREHADGGQMSPEHHAELVKIWTRVKEERQNLTAKVRALDRLQQEAELFLAWNRGEASLTSVSNAWRSFERFVSAGNWAVAASCVTGGVEATAKEFARTLADFGLGGNVQVSEAHVGGEPVSFMWLSTPVATGEVRFAVDAGGLYRIAKVEITPKPEK